MRQNGNGTIKVDKVDLIAKIEENRENHIKSYTKAVKAYKKEALKQLKELTANVKSGDIKVSLDLTTPIDNKENYDKIIEMFDNKKDIPSSTELRTRAGLFKLETGKKIEIMAVPAEYIRNLDFDVKLIANPKSEQTKESEQALQLEKVRVYKSFWPNLVNDPELAAQTAEKMGDDPTKVFKDEIFPGLADEGAVKSQIDNGVNTTPEGNVSNNIARSLRSGGGEAGQLQNQIVG